MHIYTRIYIRHLFYCEGIFIEMLAKKIKNKETKKKQNRKPTESKLTK